MNEHKGEIGDIFLDALSIAVPQRVTGIFSRSVSGINTRKKEPDIDTGGRISGSQAQA